MNQKIIVNTDGGAIGNPGPSGIGIVINIAGKIKEYSESIGEGTNNQAEYKAVIFALKKIKSLIGKNKIKDAEVEIFADSQLIVNQLEGKYKIMEDDLKILFVDAWNLKIGFKNVSLNYIPREQNKKADKLVKEAFAKFSSSGNKLF